MKMYVYVFLICLGIVIGLSNCSKPRKPEPVVETLDISPITVLQQAWEN